MHRLPPPETLRSQRIIFNSRFTDWRFEERKEVGEWQERNQGTPFFRLSPFPFRLGGCRLKGIRLLRQLESEGEKLLAMDYKSAFQLFQSYPQEQQLAIIEATRDPKKREELYYLVPDCTELVRESKVEDVLQIIDLVLGTGLSVGILSAISSEQFEKIFDISAWRDGKLDEQRINLWIGELAECEPEDLEKLLTHIDISVLAQMLRGKVDLSDISIDGVTPQTYKGMFAETGIIDLNAMEYDNEQVRFIMETIWSADEDYFRQLLHELFAQEEEEEEEEGEKYKDRARKIEFERAQERRDRRIRERDEEAGIDVDEEELFTYVDLENLGFEDDELGFDDEEFTLDDSDDNNE